MRIGVTGIGLVTPFGNDLWECVSKGISKGFKIEGYKTGKDRFIDIAKHAAKKAIQDSNLTKDILKNTGVTLSSSKGGIIFNDVINMPNYIGEEFGCHGPSLNIISACATGLNSIIIGLNIIRSGRAKVVISGAVDACLNEFIRAGFSKLGVLAKDGICRPYSKNRSGFALSEGACAIIVEELEHAKKRGAKIYAEITGWASLGDAYHITSLNPSGDTIVNAIKICLQKSGANPEDIDYINTHGTGTIENDCVETVALKKFFGNKISKIPISSTKGVTGHMLGATGAVEMAICLLAMQKKYVPPTANFEFPDPLCDLDYTLNRGRPHLINRFLNLSYGFGGHVTCIEGKRF
jgi:3-oxoacyl-[acyl-carrier-protein] synthase II